jgi:hypothetical protein
LQGGAFIGAEDLRDAFPVSVQSGGSDCEKAMVRWIIEAEITSVIDWQD